MMTALSIDLNHYPNPENMEYKALYKGELKKENRPNSIQTSKFSAKTRKGDVYPNS